MSISTTNYALWCSIGCDMQPVLSFTASSLLYSQFSHILLVFATVLSFTVQAASSMSLQAQTQISLYIYHFFNKKESYLVTPGFF